jgi:hypothetical protein
MMSLLRMGVMMGIMSTRSGATLGCWQAQVVRVPPLVSGKLGRCG